MTLTAGEPIIVHYRLTNALPQRFIRVDVGFYGTRWYTLQLMDGKGEEASIIPDRRLGPPPGVSDGPDRLLFPNAPHEGEIVVSRFRRIEQAGTYRLMVQVEMAYALSLPGQDVPNHGDLMASPARLKADFPFTLTVTEPNLNALRRTAESLQHRFVAEPSPAKRRQIAEQLFSMPERAAIGSWRSLAFDPNADYFMVAEGLSQSQSPLAAELLVRMEAANLQATKPVREPFVNRRFSVLPLLRDMSEQGDDAMKTHIADLKKRYHLDKIVVPQIAD